MVLDADRERLARSLILEGGHSAAEIARRAGIARSTAQAMVRGRRSLQTDPAASPAVGKCPQCGRKIELPCRACRVEYLRAHGLIDSIHPAELTAEENLSVALRDEDAERYLALRRRLDVAEWLAETDPQAELEPSDADLVETQQWLDHGMPMSRDL